VICICIKSVDIMYFEYCPLQKLRLERNNENDHVSASIGKFRMLHGSDDTVGYLDISLVAVQYRAAELGMRGSSLPALRSATSSVARPTEGGLILSLRPISSSAYCRDATREAESSTSTARQTPPGRSEAYPGETREDVFRRNLREVQAWRRRRESLRRYYPFNLVI